MQQVMWVAVAVAAHHHQGHKGRQEYGGQHADGHDHHRFHGDSGGAEGEEEEEEGRRRGSWQRQGGGWGGSRSDLQSLPSCRGCPRWMMDETLAHLLEGKPSNHCHGYFRLLPRLGVISYSSLCMLFFLHCSHSFL